MPSTRKTLHYISSALVTTISVGVLGYSMSAKWGKATMECANSLTSKGFAVFTLGLFNGTLNRNDCPSFVNMFPMLVEIGSTPLVLHALVVSLLVLCLVFSAANILISIYNSVSNPYETYMGPVGIYTCGSLSACLSVLVLIIFVLNVNFTNMAEETVKNFPTSSQVELLNKYSEMMVGYYLIILYAVLSLSTIALIYMYDHAAYTHRKEQQKPTEDVPKEIMMY
uniref:Uncharacterized protein n=1 Tax=Mola mola TaxID=94237 RepID=A0A3Q3WZE2_MOLML